MAQKKHGSSTEIIERGPNNSWQTWLTTCDCGKRWTGESYPIVEDKWRMHVHETTGLLVAPAGDKNGRWSA